MVQFEEAPLRAIWEKLQVLEAKLEKRQPTDSPDEMGDVHFAAQVTSLSVSTIYKLTSSRKIPHFKRGGSNRYSKSQLIAWMQENQPKTEQQIRAEAQERNSSIKKKKPG